MDGYFRQLKEKYLDGVLPQDYSGGRERWELAQSGELSRRRGEAGERGGVVTAVGVLWSSGGPCRDGTEVICGKREKGGRYVTVVMTGWEWQILEAGVALSLPGALSG